MTKDELNTAVDDYQAREKELITYIWNSLKNGAKNQMLKNENIRPILKRNGITSR